MPKLFSKRRCWYWVQLACGHDGLVSDGQLYSGSGFCRLCAHAGVAELFPDGKDCVMPSALTEAFLRAGSKKILRRWNLVERPSPEAG